MKGIMSDIKDKVKKIVADHLGIEGKSHRDRLALLMI